MCLPDLEILTTGTTLAKLHTPYDAYSKMMHVAERRTINWLTVVKVAVIVEHKDYHYIALTWHGSPSHLE